MVNYHRTLASSLALSFLLAGSAAHAGGVEAGTLIENTATATYEDGTGSVSVPSNTVTLRVDEVLDVTVTSLNPGPVSASSGSAVLTFEVTNIGNGPEAFRLTANPNTASNDFVTDIEAIAVDSNDNGSYEPGVDAILTGPETTKVLDAGENVKVFVIATIPGMVLDGQKSAIDLLAEAVTGTGAPGTVFAAKGVDGGDAIVGGNGADDNKAGSIIIGITTVDLVKSATIADPWGGTSAVPGSVVSYTITANVKGRGSVTDLVVADVFPAGTTYTAGTLALNAAALTDADDGDAGESSATGISVSLGTVAGGTNHSVTFDVTID
ncbi:MAG: hypothetical protein CL575_10345 [Altererythrobacter sp.]|mgnify:FL=1|nr:hypothetical protein [Altererythrobacter sp.]MBK63321.1 hypothetical protein [Altererythrobacter sp.]|tara:strand:+ start:622 stop:1593 length:972 start_codon:yes stop_codon:yes gene_type:complete